MKEAIELDFSELEENSQGEKLLQEFKEKENQMYVESTMNSKNSLHAAALRKDLEKAKFLLKEGADPNAVDELGRTPLHCAAITSSKEILETLIAYGASVDVKIRNSTLPGEDPNFGRTALHIAAAQLDPHCARVLLQSRANVNSPDADGLTPLQSAGKFFRRHPKKFDSGKDYESTVVLLLDWNAEVKFIDSKSGATPLRAALEFESINAFRELLRKGADPSAKDNRGDTILHVSCNNGRDAFAKEVLLAAPGLVNAKNHRGDTALHCAALVGSRSCLTLLMNNGGDLSEVNSSNLTVCDLIFSYVPRPLNFLVETLDSQLIPNEISINDKSFKVTLDFQVLTPPGGNQTSVLTALINSLPYDQKSKIVLHPLISTFIKLKWTRLRHLFFVLVTIHFMFVMSLSLHVCFLIKGQSMSVYRWSRFVLLFTSAVIFVHILTQVLLSPKYFLKEFETWLTLACVSLSLTLGIWETFFMFSPMPPVWVRHLAAYDVLLSWILLMFTLGRFPLMGYVALMFFTVFKNVVKVLMFFTCLVIGFSLSFCVQFDDMQFDDPWKAFVRTTIMLMGEYEYGELFDGDKLMRKFQGESKNLFVTSRIIFLMFVLLGCIVLVNLLTGLAVNDIQGLRAEGCLRHLIKQAEFISHVEKISKKHLNSKIIPKRFLKFINSTQTLPKTITISPNIGGKTCETNNKRKLKGISRKHMESIMLSALKNQKKNLKNLSEDIILKDGLDMLTNTRNQWVDTHINEALNDIKQELQVLSSQLLHWKEVKT